MHVNAVRNFERGVSDPNRSTLIAWRGAPAKAAWSSRRRRAAAEEALTAAGSAYGRSTRHARHVRKWAVTTKEMGRRQRLGSHFHGGYPSRQCASRLPELALRGGNP